MKLTNDEKIIKIQRFKESDIWASQLSKVIYVDFKAKKVFYEETGDIPPHCRFSEHPLFQLYVANFYRKF